MCSKPERRSDRGHGGSVGTAPVLPGLLLLRFSNGLRRHFEHFCAHGNGGIYRRAFAKLAVAHGPGGFDDVFAAFETPDAVGHESFFNGCRPVQVPRQAPHRPRSPFPRPGPGAALWRVRRRQAEPFAPRCQAPVSNMISNGL